VCRRWWRAERDEALPSEQSYLPSTWSDWQQYI